MTTMKRWVLAAFPLALIATSLTSAAPAEDSKCSGTSMTTPLISENNSAVTGQAELCITKAGVGARVCANALTAGNPYTFWFIYFDNPAKCLVPGSCSDADVFTPVEDPEGAFGRYDSIIASAGPNSFLGGSALQPSSGSVVTLEILSHGVLNADGRIRARQLLTPQIPILGAPGLGTDSDGAVGSLVADAHFVMP